MLNFKNFKSDTDGNVAMMFAVSLVMLLTGVGAAVDYSNMSRAQSMLQSQVDAGVLAAASVEFDNTNEGIGDGSNAEEQQARETAAKNVIEANGFSLTDIAPVLTLNESSVVLKAEVDYKPFFGGILGINEIRLSADAESGLPGADGVDIALVLDSTHSMSVDGKMEAMIDGAVSLVETIQDGGSNSKVSLVPFSRYVRINDSLRTSSWFELPEEYDTERTYQQATHTGGTCTTETRTRTDDGVEEEYEASVCTGQTTTYETKTTTIESRWEGCVGTRLPPYSETDASYSHRIPGLLRRVAKEESGLSYDLYSNCPAEIVPLTDEYDDLISDIKAMRTTDDTYLPTGLIWGQRVLSAGEPFDNVSSSGEFENRKVMVLMTDGNNTTEIMQDSDSESALKSPPYIGEVDDDEVATAANAATARLCTSAKASGIEIYTIAFQVTDAATKTLLGNCATDASKALTADSNVALVEEFEKVAESLKEDIRLMR